MADCVRHAHQVYRVLRQLRWEGERKKWTKEPVQLLNSKHGKIGAELEFLGGKEQEAKHYANKVLKCVIARARNT